LTGESLPVTKDPQAVAAETPLADKRLWFDPLTYK
jgi:hypothetical protein